MNDCTSFPSSECSGVTLRVTLYPRASHVVARRSARAIVSMPCGSTIIIPERDWWVQIGAGKSSKSLMQSGLWVYTTKLSPCTEIFMSSKFNPDKSIAIVLSLVSWMLADRPKWRSMWVIALGDRASHWQRSSWLLTFRSFLVIDFAKQRFHILLERPL